MYKFYREVAIVLYEDQTISCSHGTASHVEFNFDEVWDYKKSISDFDPSKLHFVHVHPPVFCECSSLDINCIEGLTVAFGYPVIFSIICFKSETAVINSYQWQKELIKINPVTIADETKRLLKRHSSKDTTFEKWAKKNGCKICKELSDERGCCMLCRYHWLKEIFQTEEYA